MPSPILRLHFFGISSNSCILVLFCGAMWRIVNKNYMFEMSLASHIKIYLKQNKTQQNLQF